MRRKSSAPASTSSSLDGIRRRDFINGVLVSAGGAALSSLLSGCQEETAPIPPPQGLCDGTIGGDMRALRGGNLPSTFNIGHWMRDERLTWSENSVTISPLS